MKGSAPGAEHRHHRPHTLLCRLIRVHVKPFQLRTLTCLQCVKQRSHAPIPPLVAIDIHRHKSSRAPRIRSQCTPKRLHPILSHLVTG
jgi:hypothetical protein